MAVTGVNFRSTAGHATDDTGFSSCTNTNGQYSSAQGFGWTSGPTGSRDRPYSGYDNNFAGVHYSATNGHTFRLDLPNGAGTYKVWAIHADLGSPNVTGYRYKDGSTTIATIQGTVSYASAFLDITNTFDAVTDFDQPNEHWLVHTFTSDHLIIERDTSLGTGNGVISSVWVEPFTPPSGLGDEKLWLCPSLDDSAGDLSGNGNHGTYYGGMGTVADTSNGGTRAYLLDGSNTQRIECPASAIGSEPIISVSCWGYVNVHDASYGEGLVSQFGAGNNSSTCKFSLATLGGSSIFPANWIRPSTTNVTAASTNAISAQSWHHFCLVADGSTIYNYVDGVLQASTSYTGSVRSVTNPFVIGTYNQLINSNHYLNGRIDDVRAFDRALSTSEITALASKRGYEAPAAGDIPHALSSPFHPLG